MSTTREVLHLSLGAPACQVTAHLLNLEGLAATTSDENNDNSSALCDPSVTHTTHQQVYVPRVLLVDEPATFRRSNVRQQQQQQQQQGDDTTDASALHVPTWKGAVERLDHRAPPSSSSSNPESSLSSSLYNYGQQQQQQQQQQLDRIGGGSDAKTNTFLETASTLAYGPYSRYRAPANSAASARNSMTYNISSSNDRHVNWDADDDDEEEEEEDDRDDERQRDDRAQHQRRQKQQWQQQTQVPLQHQLNDFWNVTNTNISTNASAGATTHNSSPQSQPPTPIDFWANPNIANISMNSSQPTTIMEDAPAPAVNNGVAAPVQQQQSSIPTNFTWMDYWMPPYHPHSCLPLSVHTDSELVHHWNSYTTGTGDNSVAIVEEWKRDVLLESLRTMLEDCDSCQGVTIASSGHGMYAGLSTVLLQELQEECPSAVRWVWSIQDNEQDDNDNNKNTNKDDSTKDDKTSWHASHVQRLRRQVETGLAFHSHMELATSVLPLQLPGRGQLPSTLSPTAAALAPAAYVAAALESATLPYRLSGENNSNCQSRLALNSYYYGSFGGDSPFGTAPKLGFGEFLSSLQPSCRHTILELDALLPGSSQDKRPLWNRLQEGTSVERDHRMRDTREQRSRDVLPGAWLLDKNTHNDGLLTSLSPQGTGAAVADRSSHQHFGLSTSVRTTLPSTGSSSDATTLNYVTCMMQGMGIRYRPESSIATVVNQSLSTLTGTNGYAAGSYWQSVYGGGGSGSTNTPVLSVLGNSTRVYPQLQQVSQDMKQAMMPRSRGYYNRDVTNGLLPEQEDCQEALATCLDVRDLYRPPSGSGLAADEEGTYFDEC
jgi:hypothetical protein